MNKQKMTPSAAIAICLLIACVIYLMIIKRIAKNELDNNHKFTISYVTKHLYLNKAGQSIDYTFKFKNKEYKSVQLGSGLSHSLHKNFIVKFNPDNHDNSKILLDKEVKRDATPPVEGWTKIPKGILK